MRIEQLEAELTTALLERTSLNSFSELLSFTESDDSRLLYKAIFALYRLFTVALASPFYSKPQSSEVLKVTKWLDIKIDNFTDVLSNLLHHEVADIRISSLDILMSLFKYRCANLSKCGRHPVHHRHFRAIAHSLLATHDGSSSSSSSPQSDVLRSYANKWYNTFWDIRWLTLREIQASVRSGSLTIDQHQLALNSLSLLEQTQPLMQPASFWIDGIAKSMERESSLGQGSPDDDEDDWRTFFEELPAGGVAALVSRSRKLPLHEALQSLPAHAAQISSCWISLIPSLTSSVALSARALEILNTATMPQSRQAIKLMDWISGCVDYGGSIGLLALSVMHHLMTTNNFDYPDFYTRLYGYLDHDCLHTKHRSRFLRLLDRFMRSTHLPTNLLASYIKRLSRLSLAAPPSALVAIMPLVYNIIRQHSQLMIMIHNSAQDFSNDPYDERQTSPYDTDAISSSLWEIMSLEFHYNPSVAGLSHIFSEAFSKPSYAVEDFLDQSYSTLFRSEHRKILKLDPVVSDSLQSLPSTLWSMS